MLIAASPGLYAQVLLKDMWVPNGKVNTLEADASAGVDYFGGSFTYVGPDRSFGAVLGLSDGELNMSVPSPNNQVLSVAPDGNGGWYIGGKFTSVGGQTRNRMARINADGSLHPFNPNFSSLSTEVRAIAVHGDTVFAGGSFDFVNSQVRQNFVALSANTGANLSIVHNTDNPVQGLDVLGGTLYMVGRFSQVDGLTRNHCAAITISTGGLAGWNPNTNNTTSAVVAAAGGIYLAGIFTQVGSIPRQRIAKVDPLYGTAQAWDPFASGYSCDAIALSGSTLFVAGVFTSIGGEFRNGIAALDTNTGLATPWAPTYVGAVASLVTSGDSVFIGGDLTSVNGEPRWHVAAIDATTGTTLDFAPVTDGGTIAAVGVQNGHVYAGGAFTSIGGVVRNNAAAVDVVSGRATAWDPQANGEVFALARRGADLYLGGAFDQLAGASRTALGAMDNTGALLPWDPQANGDVRAIAVMADTLYAVGDFTEMGGQTRNGAARFTGSNGTLTAWSPSMDNRVYAVEPHGSVVYLGGDFTTVNGDTRNRLAAVSLATGVATGWDPDAPNTVLSISATDDAVYVGGTFYGTIGGQYRGRAAKLDPATGLATPWNPAPSGDVYVIKAVGDSVLLGGTFSSVASAPRFGLGVTNNTTGAALPFKLDPSQNGLFDFEMSPGYFHLAGGFTYVNGPIAAGGTPRKYLAVFVTNTLTGPTVNGPVCPGFTYPVQYAVEGGFGAGNVFTAELSALGADFSSPIAIGSQLGVSSGTMNVTIPGNTPPGANYRIRIRSSQPAQVGANSNPFTVGQPSTWYVDVDNDGFGVPGTDSLSCVQPTGYVPNAFDCDDTDNSIHLGASCDDGDPNTINEVWLEDCTCGNGQYTGGGLVFDTVPGWWMTDGPVLAIAPDTANNRVFIGGQFDFLYPQYPWRPYGCEVNAANAAPYDGVSPNGIVHQALPDGAGGWFICGEFTTVGGTARNHIARIDANGTLNAWNVDVNGTVFAMLISGSNLFIGGGFTQVNGTARTNLAAVGTSSGVVTGWAPTADNTVRQFVISGSNLYFRGNFTQVNGYARNHLAAVSTAGVLQEWSPTYLGGIWGMAATTQGIYLGGIIYSVNGATRNNLAMVNPTTGNLFTWAPNPGGYVTDIAIYGNTVYVSGSFPGGIKAFESFALGDLIWNGNASTSVSRVFTVGASIIVAGDFDSVGGGAAKKVAKLTGTTGLLIPWEPGVTGDVNTAALSTNSSKMYLGGDFQILGAKRRANLACIDMGTGVPQAWNPGANDQVHALALSGTALYAGGQFTQIGTASRPHLAGINANNGNVSPFNPAPNGDVEALAVGGGLVYAGGYFSTVLGGTRNSLAALDPVNGSATAWNPGPNYTVRALAYDSGLVYAGGDFVTIGTQTRRYAAVIDVGTGLPTAWNAGFTASDPQVNTLLLKGEHVYLGTTGDLRIRDRITAANVPLISSPDNAVNGLASIGRTVFLGGGFTAIGTGGVRLRMASFDTQYEQYGPFNPGLNAAVSTLAAGGGMLFAGGDFTTVSGSPRTHFAAFALVDCNNIAGGGAVEGAPCDDGDPATENDVWSADCTCAGDLGTIVPEPPEANGLKAYPVPVSRVLHLSEVVDGTIHDIHGRKLAVITHSDQIEVSGLSPGVYFLRTSQGEVLRFVKE